MPIEIDTEPASQQEVPISDDPSSKDLPPEGCSAGHPPYGVDTIVVPFTWSGPQRRRMPWRRFGGNRWATGPDTPSYVGQSCAIAERQLATALKDVQQTSTDLALSALYPRGADTASAAGASAPSIQAVRIKAAADAGLSSGSGATVGLGTLTRSHTSRLGDLSMPYETGYSQGHEGKAAGVVSSGAGDDGGVSYGAHQFASSGAGGRQVQAFLKSPEGARWADRFKGLDPTQPGGAFAQEWKRIAANEPDEFFQAQHEYTKRTHYDPVVQKVQHATSLDINQRSRALQNVVWSMSVQHGGAASLVTRAVQQAGPQGSLSNAEYDRKLINQLYAARNAYVDRLGQPGLKTRYAAEQHDALRELEGEKP